MKKHVPLTICAIVLILFISLTSALTTHASAATVDSGTCGGNLTWELDENGLLTISGTGDMYDYSDAPWYELRKKIATVVIEEGVTSIGNYAFEYCSSLESITIPAGVTSIGSGAFNGCSSLESVTIPDSVTSIGGIAFQSCSNLTSISIPDSVTSIGELVFYNCSRLTDVYITDIDAWCKIYFRWASNPLYYGAKLYLGGVLVTDLEIPDSVSSIGSYAFSGCSSLTSITIPDSVTSIGSYAFYDCSSLETVTIGNGVTSIGEYAFYDCSSLETVTIGNSVTSIGEYAFFGCSSLASITLPFLGGSVSSNSFFGYIFGAKNYTYSADYVPSSLKTVILLDTCTRIPSCAFYGCSSLESVTIGNGVTSIGNYAFEDCSSLESVTIGNGVTSIGKKAFDDCSSLTDVYITDIEAWCKISFADTVSNPLYYGRKLHLNGELVTDLEIPDSITSIGYAAFFNCSSLKSVVIGNGVTSIGEYAFSGCSSLESITIPDSVTSIDSDAFSGCSSLESITIPDSVTSIGYAAFRSCSSLKEIKFTGDAPALGDRIFSGVVATAYYPAGNNTWTANVMQQYDGTITWIAYCDHDWQPATCTAPKTCAKCGATEGESLGHTRDSNHKCTVCGHIGGTCGDNLTWELDDSGTLTISGTGAMYDYSYGSAPWYSYEAKIKQVFVADGVTSIGKHAFSWIRIPLGVTIADSVTNIGCDAFFGSYIGTVTIGSGVASIGEGAFYFAELNGIVVDADNTNYCSADGVLFDKNKTIIIKAGKQCSSYYFIPDTVAYIEDFAFYRCELVSVEIGGNVTEIGTQAFAESYLTTIKFLGDAPDDGGDAFVGVTAVAYYPEGNITWTENVMQNYGGTITWVSYKKPSEGLKFTLSDDGTYYIVSGIGTCTDTDVVIPGTYNKLPVKMIGYKAFFDCDNMTSVTIGNSVTSIGARAFDGCSSLTSITIPDSVTSIGAYAFSGCSSLTSITIPDSVTSIGESAFQNCSNLTSITIPDSVTSIGSYAFWGCRSWTDVYITDIEAWCKISFGYDTSNPLCYGGKLHLNGELVTDLEIPNSVTSIGSYAFYGCRSLTSVTIPDSVTSIGSSAFYGCSSLIKVTIGNSVTSIGSSAFYGCSSLIKVTVGTSVTEISYETFYGCSNLVGIALPGSVTSIGSYAFYGCRSLTSITIPDRVTSIGSYAFDGCGDLESVTIGNSVASIGEYAFHDCFWLKDVYITDIEAWCKISFDDIFSTPLNKGGKLYLNGVLVTDLEIPNSITSIGSYAFYGCRSLTSVTIPDSVTSIGFSAFSDCSSLESVTIGNSVTSIGSSAFSDCSSLESITIPDSVTSIGQSAFARCSRLENVTIGNGVTSIGSYAFSSCSSLESIEIPDSVTSIGSYAFYNCSSLTSITIPDGIIGIGNSAFSACGSLWHVLYKGTEAQWDEIAISSNNEYLTKASRHYECQGDEFLDPVRKICSICIATCDHSYTLNGNHTCEVCKYSKTPDAPVVESKTYNSVTLVAVDGFEYSMDGETWQDSNVFTDLLPDTTYTFFQRVKDSDDALVSDVSAPLSGKTHEEFVAGDLTGDGKINSLDGLLLMRYLNGWDVNIASPEAMDVNGDGKVNSLDGLILMRYLNGWDVTLG